MKQKTESKPGKMGFKKKLLIYIIILTLQFLLYSLSAWIFKFEFSNSIYGGVFCFIFYGTMAVIIIKSIKDFKKKNPKKYLIELLYIPLLFIFLMQIFFIILIVLILNGVEIS